MSIPVVVQRKANWLLYLSVVLALGGSIGPQVVQAVVPPPVTFSNVPFPADSPVRVGEVVHITVQRCNNEGHEVVATRTRALQQIDTDGDPLNDHRYILAADSSTIPAGCTVYTAIATQIPDSVTPGLYRLEGVSTVRGRWKTVDVSWRTMPFEVAE